MNSNVIEIGNIVGSVNKWQSPQRGRVYSSDGVSPCLSTCGGGILNQRYYCMRNNKDGVIYKGCFIPIGGQNLSKSKRFMRDGMDGLSVTLLANNHDAGVAVYVEDDGAWLCMEEPTERSGI